MCGNVQSGDLLLHHTMTFDDAKAKLLSIGEQQLIDGWSFLDNSQRALLLEDIANLDADLLRIQQQQFSSRNSPLRPGGEWRSERFGNYVESCTAASHADLGKRLIAEGGAAALLVAGGQGTRLSFNAPKGTFPISVVRQKSLFQLFAEKVVAAGIQAGRLLPVAIMTSPHNDADTKAFFCAHGNFGLVDSQLSFFSQEELPLLDDHGHLICRPDGHLSKGPDGNGRAFAHLCASGIWDSWVSSGVKMISFILVDNPLADPFDAELIGFHAASSSELTVKSIERSDPHEKVGVLVATPEGPRIVEYSEISIAEREARLPDGHLKHRCANSGLYCFDSAFVGRVADIPLPWHLASKPAWPGGPLAWKFEAFIFDLLAYTSRICGVLYPRERCFAPLKSELGNDGVESVRSALQRSDAATLDALCGQSGVSEALELAQQFYYPTEALRFKWQGRQGPFHGYIDVNE
jgi:UDP-N-acetylglucosamine/UDP-N-acetylgalactosamine diphosphorylase